MSGGGWSGGFSSKDVQQLEHKGPTNELKSTRRSASKLAPGPELSAPPMEAGQLGSPLYSLVSAQG